MKRFWIAACLCLITTVALGQSRTSRQFLENSPDASQPLNGNEFFYLDQSGSKKIPSSSVPIIKYNATGGTVARSDADRWADNATMAPDIGVDCTNATDSTTAIQTWVNAHLTGGHLRFPNGCTFYTTSTITVADGVNIIFDSETPVGQGATPTSQWQWKGTNGGAGCYTNFANCQYVLDFEHTDHPTVQHLEFWSPGGSNCPDGFLKFDGDPQGHAHIGTAGRIIGNSFGNGPCRNPNFVAVSISPTATNNHEDYIVHDNNTYCSNAHIEPIVHDVVTDGTATITSAAGYFESNMVGRRIRLSYDNNTTPRGDPPPYPSRGYFDTTITGFTNANTITLAAAVPFTQTAVTGAIGQSYGIAYRNGASQNALQQQFSNLQYGWCAYGVYVAGGGVQVSQLTNGTSDVGVYFDGFIAQNSTLDYYASESDYIAVAQRPGASPPLEISNARFSNSSQAGNGFLQLGGTVGTLLRNNYINFGLSSTNSVFIGPYPNVGVAALGTITPGSGYVDGTYTGVPLIPTTNAPAGVNGQLFQVAATIVVSGGAVTSVTLTNQGISYGLGSVQPGVILSTPNTNLGSTGSGFSVPVLALFAPTTIPVASGSDVFPAIISMNNNWEASCCGTVGWARLGLDQMISPPAISIHDKVTDVATEVPGQNRLPCTSAGISCLLVDALMDQGARQPVGVGVQVNMGAANVEAGNQIAFRATGTPSLPAALGGLATPGSGLTYTAFQAFPERYMAQHAGTMQTMFDAAWGATTLGLTDAATAYYGFRAESPDMTGQNGTLPVMYGFACDKQKTDVKITVAWCFNNADAADKNFFAGPTMLGNNTLTVPAGGLGLAKIAADGAAPGAAGGKLELVCGTNSGTAKLIAYAGTSATPVTIFDNIGAGVTGC